MRRIGLISDTHGKRHPRVAEIFTAEGVEAIVHAGDIGPGLLGAHILNELESVAPVTVVSGNNDRDPIPGWPLNPVASLTVRVGEALRDGAGTTSEQAVVRITAVHILGHIKPIEAGTHVVVSGHTHVASAVVDDRSGALCVNPGSTSRPRAGFPASVGILDIDDERLVAGQPDSVLGAVSLRIINLNISEN